VPPELKLGINTCFAAKRWNEGGAWARIAAQSLGVRTCQLSLDLLDTSVSDTVLKDYAKTVREAVREYHIDLHSTFTGMASYSGNGLLHPLESAREASQRWFERAINFSAAAGARGTGGFLGSFSSLDAADPSRKEQLLTELTQRMRTLSDHAGRRGLEFLMFENMSGPLEFGHLIDEARVLDEVSAAPTPWVLCLDVGHIAVLSDDIPDGDSSAWIAEPWAHQPVLQLQQACRGVDHHWPFTAERNHDGLVDGAAVVSELQNLATEGTVFMFLEIMHSVETPDEVVIRELNESVQYWVSKGVTV
jgi:sugar phosphate isomerase/epimerase